MNLRQLLSPTLLALMLLQSAPAVAVDTYVIDTKGAHAFIQFRIKHLGFSWLYGRFDRFEGTLNYDENAPEKSSIQVTVDTASVNSNHAERDKHLRNEDFLDVTRYPTATFFSTAVKPTGKGTADVTGKLTLHGVTREITIPVQHIGGGQDPWGGYRHGFSGRTTLKLKDYKIQKDLGPASAELELILDIEAIRQ